MRTFLLVRGGLRLPDLTGGKGGCVDRGTGQRVDEALQSVPPELAEVGGTVHWGVCEEW